MRKWIIILLTCLIALSGGAEKGVYTTPNVATQAVQSVQSAQQVPQGGELTVCRRRLADAATEYASNPAHLHFGTASSAALQRCPVTAASGSRWLRAGGTTAAAALGGRCAARFITPIPRAVLHPVDYYVFRLRRLLI